MSAPRRTLVIAEAGVNHNGSLDRALKLVDAAVAAGADAVKFQTFTACKVASRLAPKAAYQAARTPGTRDQVAMLEQLELSRDAHQTLAAHCRAAGIEFMSTAFDEGSLDFLVDEVGIGRVKIPSGEITNAPYLLHAAGRGLPVLLSTGMSALDEVELALGVLAAGFTAASARTLESFASARASVAGVQALRERVTVLHCTSLYPAPPGQVNLLAMDTLSSATGLPVGYSDHTLGIAVSIAAVARGAVVIEKHLTLDRALPGPDHHASIEPAAFADLVSAIRTVEQALGNAEKIPSADELLNRPAARRSLVAARDIPQGGRFDAGNVAVKRPGTGISPLHYWEWLGKVAEHNYDKDDLLT